MNNHLPHSDRDSGSTLNAIVTQRSEVAPGLIVLRVAPDQWLLPRFEPGQYAVLGLPGAAPRCLDSEPDDKPAAAHKLIKRAYSIASSSQASEYLEFYIALVRSGSLTPRLFALNVGSRVWLGRKLTGRFTLETVPTHCGVIMFATGTGLAPYVSMMRTSLEQELQRRFIVVHGARHSWELGYAAEMISLQRICPRFHYVPLISRPDEEPIPWGGLVGYCQDVWEKNTLSDVLGVQPTPEDTHILLCGNPSMVEDMFGLLSADGFHEHTRKSPGQVHAEKYW